MRYACLCPVWNHRDDTIANAIQCFLDQTHDDAFLVVGDDRPAECQIGRIVNAHKGWSRKQVFEIYSETRFETLGEKYNWMLDTLDDNGVAWDAIAIWDDDDGFTCRHLELAQIAYDRNPEALWTYPATVFTTFGGYIHTEPSGGRFWSSITFKRELLERMTGSPRFPVTKMAGFDQMFLGAANKVAVPAQPDHPSYVYRWDGRSGENHTSGYMTGFNCETWMQQTPYSCSGNWVLVPGYTEDFVEDLDVLMRDFRDSVLDPDLQ